MIKVVIVIFLFFIIPTMTLASICERPTSIRENLQEQLGLPCDKVEIADLVRIKTLIVPNSANFLASLKKADLAGLTSLTYLSLADDGAYYFTIEPGTFDEMPDLRVLDLAHCHLTHIDEGLFKNQTKLEVLDLSENTIADLPGGTFDTLINLKYLSLEVSGNVSAENNFLKNLNNVSIANLTFSGNAKIPEDFFIGLNLLESLNILINSSEPLPSSLGLNSDKLKSLYIRSNKALTLGFDFFKKIPNLESLRVDMHEAAVTLLSGAFDNTVKLTEVLLEYCYITNIPDNLFSPLKNLSFLVLSHNNIISVGATTFSPENFSKNAKVYFDSNPLTQEAKDLLNTQLGDRVIMDRRKMY